MNVLIRRGDVVSTILAVCCLSAVGQESIETKTTSAGQYRIGLMFARDAGSKADGGLQIYDVVPGGAADRAGLRAHDVITHVNGQVCNGPPSDFADVFGRPDPITLRVVRDGKSLEIRLTPEKFEVTHTQSTGTVQSKTPGGSGTVARLKTRMDYGKPTVDAWINGKGPWPFFVDTGAGVTVINHELVKKLSLPITGKQRVGGPSDPESINADVVKLDSIKLGAVEFRDLEVVSWDRSGLYSAADRPQGVLGIGLFADYLLTFDYPSREIVLDQGELPAVDHNEIIPFVIAENGLPAIEVSLCGRTFAAHFDTGSPASIGVPAKLESQLKLKSRPKIIGKARTVDAEFELRSAKLDGDLRIGGFAFKNPDVLLIGVLDDMNAVNIGSRLLRDFRLTFDQKNMRVRLQRK